MLNEDLVIVAYWLDENKLTLNRDHNMQKEQVQEYLHVIIMSIFGTYINTITRCKYFGVMLFTNYIPKLIIQNTFRLR